MSPLPYLPAGVDDLPAQRHLLFADPNHRVHRLDESVITVDYGNHFATWNSPTLNRPPGRIATLQELHIYYSSNVATTLGIDASGDGGYNWSSRTLTINAGNVDVQVGVLGFNVTGKDIRFRMVHNLDTLFNIFGYKPIFVERGGLIL